MTTHELLHHLRECFDAGINPKIPAFVLSRWQADLWYGTVSEASLHTGTLTNGPSDSQIPVDPTLTTPSSASDLA